MSSISSCIPFLALMVAVSAISEEFFIDEVKYDNEGVISVDYKARKIQINCGDKHWSQSHANTYFNALSKASRFRTEDGGVAPNWLVVNGIENPDKRSVGYVWNVSFNYTNIVGIHADEKNVTEFKTAALDFHNQQRAKHGCAPLELDPALSEHALDSARKWANSEVLNHVGYVTNIASMESTTTVLKSLPCGNGAVRLIKHWYEDGVKKYNYDLGSLEATEIAKLAQESATFINMIWKDTTHVGIGIFYGIREDSGEIYKTVHIVAYYNTSRTKETLQKNIPKPE